MGEKNPKIFPPQNFWGDTPLPHKRRHKWENNSPPLCNSNPNLGKDLKNPVTELLLWGNSPI